MLPTNSSRMSSRGNETHDLSGVVLHNGLMEFWGLKIAKLFVYLFIRRNQIRRSDSLFKAFMLPFVHETKQVLCVNKASDPRTGRFFDRGTGIALIFSYHFFTLFTREPDS